MPSARSFPLAGATVWVTGASAGIGAACARDLAGRGARVVVSARRAERLEALARELAAAREDAAWPLPCDVTDGSSVAAAAEAIGRRGGLDALVANAGIGAFVPVEATTEAALRAVVETNLCGVVRCIRAALPLLRRGGVARAGGSPRIVLVSSSVAWRGFPGLGVYSATKAALHALADALRVELHDERIAVSLVAPGLTATEFAGAALGSPGAADRGGIAPERVAEVVARALLRGGAVYALNPKARVAGLLNVLVPRLLDRRLLRFAPPAPGEGAPAARLKPRDRD